MIETTRKAPMKRYVFLGIAWLCLGIGAVGIVVPILPTTPLVLLAGFLFARSSPKLDAWLKTTRLYRGYVVPFLENEGIPPAKKARMLAVSLSVLALSAFAVRKPLVWVVLGCCAAFLLYLVLIRIPTSRTNPPSPATAPRRDLDTTR